jgi:hypothetical protein
MTGMETVIALRRERVIPGCVFLALTPKGWRNESPLSRYGNVTVHVEAHESLNDLDLRPLVGLYVHVTDFTADAARHRRLAKLVADVNPRLLVMPVGDGEQGAIVYRRTAGEPPTTETIHL